MPVFAEPRDLSGFLGITFSDNEKKRAEQALDQAAAVVEGYIGQPLDAVKETVALVGGGTAQLFLPTNVVASVSSVVEAGVVLPTTAYRLDPGGALARLGGVWARGYAVVVSYTRGFLEVPEDVKLATLTVAREIFEFAHPQTAGTTPEGPAAFARVYPSRVLGIGWQGLVERYRMPVVA